MLKVSNFVFICNVFPFQGEIINCLYSLPKTGETISPITEYVDIVNVLLMRHKSFDWCKESILSLQTQTSTFRKSARADFGKYPASKMITQKWHALDYLCKGIRHVGRIERLHAGVPKYCTDKLRHCVPRLREENVLPWIKGSDAEHKSPEASYKFFSLHCAGRRDTNCAREPHKMDPTVFAPFDARSTLLTFASVMFEIK